MLSQEIINVYDGKAAQEYELALTKKTYKSIAKKWLTNGKNILHLHFSGITVYAFFPYNIFSTKKSTLFFFYNVVIPYFTHII